jgi:hypothetical protein
VPTSPALADWRDLARSFPVIRDYAPDTDTLFPHTLDAWAAIGVEARGAAHAARFLLETWNSRYPWRAGTFDLFDALAAWDGGQRAAFQAWAADGCRTF